MKLAMISNAVMWINALPRAGGVSTTTSPRTILLGTTLDYNKHCKLPFGTYVQVYNYPKPTNTQHDRKIGAIALHPDSNFQGGYTFMSLVTGKIISRKAQDYTQLPTTKDVIERVHILAQRKHQAGKQEGLFEFTMVQSLMTTQPISI